MAGLLCFKAGSEGSGYDAMPFFLCQCITHEAEHMVAERTGWWEHVLNKHEDGLFWADPDPLPDDIDKLTYSEIRGYKVPAVVAPAMVQMPSRTLSSGT